MASLALGVAGGVIGGMIGGPLGAKIGFLAGAAIGSYVDKELNKQTQEGPRLHDKSVQVSAYGGMIPIVRGTMGVAGNVIWSSDLVEEEREEEIEGQEVKLYYYFANLA